MTKRIVLGLAAGLLTLGLGTFEVRAAQIPLPSPLPPLEVAGNYAIVANLKFSDFTYVTTPLGSPPTAANVTVAPFTSVVGEPGISFNGAFTAAAGQTVDYAITYIVQTTNGTSIDNAFLSLGGFINSGGTGSVSIGETITDMMGNTLGQLQVFTPSHLSDTTKLMPPNSMIMVQKDITVIGGSNGATFSFVNQGFSVPEPASLALLGIGLSGLFSIRRFLRKRAVA